MKIPRALLIAAALAVAVFIIVQAASLPGAIFTTTPNGGIVNENVRYEQKIEVYLDGGPGPNAPQTAAGLPDGNYYFQVTDPSGAVLLSQDPAVCREVQVAGGVIVKLLSIGRTYTVKNSTIPCSIQDAPNPPYDPHVINGVAGPSGRHDTNVDLDHGMPAIVVQLMPFYDTPNPGGVYKAWMVPVDRYVANGGDPNAVPVVYKVKGAQLGYVRDPGFGPSRDQIKTDNFKVKKTKFIPPVITVKKFHDKNANGYFDNGDEWVTGWRVDVTDPTDVINSVWTPATILAEPPGVWWFDEENPAGTLQTASFVDGAQTVPFPKDPVDLTVAGTSNETHEVVFGNVGLGTVNACKVYDRNANGAADAGEPPVAGWKMELTGPGYGPVDQLTGEDGCTTFSGLLPGDYTLGEIFPAGSWSASGPTSYNFTIVSTLTGNVISGGTYDFTFTNYCTCFVSFSTKGYWHNKNGLSELTTADRDFVNTLPPYSAPSAYFDDGDEPFDGVFQDGTPVAAAFNNDDNSLIWGAGTWQAEVSLFLVDENAGGGGGDQEQLAQQLLAFILNVRHRLDDPGTLLYANGQWMSAQSIIDQAIAAWASPTTDDDKIWEPILDGLNNNNYISIIRYYPCEVVYP